jgi:hypothetical protein
MKRLLAFATVVALSLIGSGLLLAQSDLFIGTWKLNVANSSWVNVSPANSETRTVEGQGDGERVSFDGVRADGSRIAYGYTTNYDDKDTPYSGVGAPNGADTNAVKRVDASTFTATAKKAGKVVQTARLVISKDGKVMTMTTKGTNEQDQPTSSTTVWDKQ